MLDTTSPQKILELSHLSKTFRVGPKKLLHAVNNVSLSIMQGEVVGLVGESGCGKSTLGKIIIKLHSESNGTVVFDGQQISRRMNRTARKAYSRKVQMIFQDPYSSLNPRMTVLDIIAEGPDAHGMWPKNERKERVRSWLEKVGLHADHMNRYPHEFSGGQRQRLGIARALALEPDFVICDEPISALDVSVQAQIVNLLRDLQKERSLTYLFIAHDLSMVKAICDRMAVMYLGSIVEIGNADEVYSNPQHPYTQALISANPIPDPRAERTREKALIAGEISSPINIKAGCLFAPRCPFVSDRCRTVTPELMKISPGRSVSCHLFTH